LRSAQRYSIFLQTYQSKQICHGDSRYVTTIDMGSLFISNLLFEMRPKAARGGTGQGPSLGSGQLLKILQHKQTNKSLGQISTLRSKFEPFSRPGFNLDEPVLVQQTNILSHSTSKSCSIGFNPRFFEGLVLLD